MNRAKTIIHFLLLLIVAYVSLYALMGKRQIHKAIFSNSTNLIIGIDDIAVFSDYNLSQRKKESLNRAYKNHNNKYIFFDSKEDFDSHVRNTDSIVGYVYGFNNHCPFVSLVGEDFFGGNHEQIYLETWESIYIWVFIDWVLVKRECVGQS